MVALRDRSKLRPRSRLGATSREGRFDPAVEVDLSNFVELKGSFPRLEDIPEQYRLTAQIQYPPQHRFALASHYLARLTGELDQCHGREFTQLVGRPEPDGETRRATARASAAPYGARFSS